MFATILRSLSTTTGDSVGRRPVYHGYRGLDSLYYGLTGIALRIKDQDVFITVIANTLLPPREMAAPSAT